MARPIKNDLNDEERELVLARRRLGETEQDIAHQVRMSAVEFHNWINQEREDDFRREYQYQYGLYRHELQAARMRKIRSRRPDVSSNNLEREIVRSDKIGDTTSSRIDTLRP